MDFKIFAAIHASSYKSSKWIANWQIQSLHIWSIYSASWICSQQTQYFLRLSKYDLFYNFYNSTFLTSFAWDWSYGGDIPGLLDVQNSEIKENIATYLGGGIYNKGTLLPSPFVDSQVHDNNPDNIYQGPVYYGGYP